MRVAVSTTGTGAGARFDGHFARCANFVVTDDESGKSTVVANAGATVGRAAGPAAARSVIDAGVDVVVTGWIGPHAYQALSRRGIKVYAAPPHTVEAALEALNAGQCEEIGPDATVERAGRTIEAGVAFEPGMSMGMGMAYRHGYGGGMGRGRGGGFGGGRGRGAGRGRSW